MQYSCRQIIWGKCICLNVSVLRDAFAVSGIFQYRDLCIQVIALPHFIFPLLET